MSVTSVLGVCYECVRSVLQVCYECVTSVLPLGLKVCCKCVTSVFLFFVFALLQLSTNAERFSASRMRDFFQLKP